jgi:ribosomal protein S27AE
MEDIIFTDKETNLILEWVRKGSGLSSVLYVEHNEEERSATDKLRRVLHQHRDRSNEVWLDEKKCPNCGANGWGSTLMPKTAWNGCSCSECGAAFKAKWHEDSQRWECLLYGIKSVISDSSGASHA